MVYAFSVPVREEEYLLSIQVGNTWILENMPVVPGVDRVELTISGNGVQIFRLYVNGEYYTSETVDFEPHD